MNGFKYENSTEAMSMGVFSFNSILIGNEDNVEIEFEGKTFGGFYVSHLGTKTHDYGCETTALVLGQMQRFYILKGDHRKQFAEIIEQGFFKCLSYYKDNIQDSHSFSDKLVDVEGTVVT